MSYNLETALKQANDLEDEKLYGALQLARGDQRLATLLQPPPNPIRDRDDAQFAQGGRLQVMCPDLYQAALSGSANRVNELLGLTNQGIPSEVSPSDDRTDVRVLLGDAHEDNKSKDRIGRSYHGDSLCTLQDLTAEMNTVLHIAAEQGHAELVENIVHKDNTLLVSQNSRQETPLHLAARAGHHRMVSLVVFLAQESGIGAYEVLTKRSMQGDTVLHEAARHGHEDVVKVLMTVAPALSMEVNNSSMSPLYLAVIRKSVGIVKALLQCSNASAVGPNQKNALHAAVLLGSCDSEIPMMLLNWNADLANERDASSGSTPMHYAASSENVTAVASILMTAPSSVYIRDQEGLSPLHVAARMLSFPVIYLIITNYPDSFELRDNNGCNFLHIMLQQGGKEKYLNSGGEAYISLFVKQLSSKIPVFKTLVNERDNEGNTPLHLASRNGFSEVILQLIKSGADTTLMNNEGNTALDHAVSLSSFFQKAKITTTLSAYGAVFSPERQDKLNNLTDDQTTEWMDRVSKNLIVVAVLIATIAFSAAYNVPGGYNDNGVADLRKSIQFGIFLIFDAVAMSTSTSAAMLLIVTKAATRNGSYSWLFFSPSMNLLWISLFSMELAFLIAMFLILGDGHGRAAIKTIIDMISVGFFMFTVLTIHHICSPAKWGTVKKFLSAMKEQTGTAHQIDIQVPMLTSYARRSRLFLFLNIIFYFTTIVVLSATMHGR